MASITLETRPLISLTYWMLSGIIILVRGMLDFPDENDPLPVSNSVEGVYKSAAVVTNTEPCSAIGR